MNVDDVKALGVQNDVRIGAIRGRGVNVSAEVLLGMQFQALVQGLYPNGWDDPRYVEFEERVQVRLSAWLDEAEEEVDRRFAELAAEQRKAQLLLGVRTDGGNNGTTGKDRI